MVDPSPTPTSSILPVSLLSTLSPVQEDEADSPGLTEVQSLEMKTPSSSILHTPFVLLLTVWQVSAHPIHSTSHPLVKREAATHRPSKSLHPSAPKTATPQVSHTIAPAILSRPAAPSQPAIPKAPATVQVQRTTVSPSEKPSVPHGSPGESLRANIGSTKVESSSEKATSPPHALSERAPLEPLTSYMAASLSSDPKLAKPSQLVLTPASSHPSAQKVFEEVYTPGSPRAESRRAMGRAADLLGVGIEDTIKPLVKLTGVAGVIPAGVLGATSVGLKAASLSAYGGKDHLGTGSSDDAPREYLSKLAAEEMDKIVHRPRAITR